MTIKNCKPSQKFIKLIKEFIDFSKERYKVTQKEMPSLKKMQVIKVAIIAGKNNITRQR